MTRCVGWCAALVLAWLAQGASIDAYADGVAASGVDHGCADGLAASGVAAAPGPRIERSALAAGRFLVAAPKLRDANFARSVVLIVDYDETGALGLIINRPTQVRLSTALPHLPAIADRADRIYVGGPVAAQRVVLLIRAPEVPPNAGLVFEDVYVSSDLATLEAAAADEATRFRAYAGYAGWAPGQLDGEVLRGDWYVAPAQAEVVFSADPESVWPELIERSGGRWVEAPAGSAVVALGRAAAPPR
jgi:putative transcriptional regulator